MNNATAPLPAASSTTYDVEVYLDGDECQARIAGCIGHLIVDYTAPEYGVNVGGGYDAGWDGAPPVLVDRAEWDKVFPGVEPTPAAIKALFDKHEKEAAEWAIALVEDEAQQSRLDYAGDY